MVSVPNGAGSKLEYLDTYIGLFDNVKRIYLAVDHLKLQLAALVQAERMGDVRVQTVQLAKVDLMVRRNSCAGHSDPFSGSCR